ncbi:ATP-binding protein [Scytonema hofmannii FACHB-248]|uniref:ATP-binding protein n=1 Tax=Scytonema hofmannii FACHB-248 TaxID=1842502 RepID=A0ABR8GYQ1_9CYAN|nr:MULTISPECIES: ATP-binding protein [Nostocales]MBD2608260.1 ATP-binding protein [Scytonema hofmannii FACHB-248]
MMSDIYLFGLPKFKDKIDSSNFQYKLKSAAKNVFEEFSITEAKILISTDKNIETINESSKAASRANRDSDELTLEQRALQYNAQAPFYNFNFLIISEEVRQNLLSAIARIKLSAKIFDEWDLKSIEPFPRTCLNLYGESGTGKTTAAHAIASHMNKPIILASYAQIESKFHGDGPKNVDALFYAAERDNAVLFIDEADSLLSKRLTDVTQGSEQAINSMRSQLLISLEKFSGVVVFATNLVENYDSAFESRVLSIKFELPGVEERKQLWIKHLPRKLPLERGRDVLIESLSEYELSGREIKNSILEAASYAALQGREYITHDILVNAIKLIQKSRIKKQPINISEKVREDVHRYAKQNFSTLPVTSD